MRTKFTTTPFKSPFLTLVTMVSLFEVDLPLNYKFSSSSLALILMKKPSLMERLSEESLPLSKKSAMRFQDENLGSLLVFLCLPFVVSAHKFVDLLTCWEAQHWDKQPYADDNVNSTEALREFNFKFPVKGVEVIPWREWNCHINEVAVLCRGCFEEIRANVRYFLSRRHFFPFPSWVIFRPSVTAWNCLFDAAWIETSVSCTTVATIPESCLG